ncbi:MAG: hypothetical protein WCK47_05315 [bacterium]
MKHTCHNFYIACICACALCAHSQFAPASTGDTTATETAAPDTSAPLRTELVECAALPKGNLSDEQLCELVPDDSPGRVIIRWRTETQENNYGFNIMRAVSKTGPYDKVNKSIIPGEGTTNIPKSYCYEDRGLPRGRIFYYYIESVSNNGAVEIVEGTKGTQVKVKTVAEEREWLRNKAAGADAATMSASQTAAPSRDSDCTNILTLPPARVSATTNPLY